MKARVAIGLVALAASIAAGAWWLRGSRTRLPGRLRIEELARDLSATLRPDAIVTASGGAVQLGGLQPGRELDLNGGYRRAILTPPPARLRWRVAVPSDAHLRFGIAVERGEAKASGEGGGVRFVVAVDDRPIFSRTVDPGRTRHDRHWFDVDLPLAGLEGDRDLELRAEPGRDGARRFGRAGWSQVRVVRDSWRDRQAAHAGAPSVLVLLIDTLRADELGCYGARPSRSPTLDALAAGGRMFDQMVSQSSWTMPAVATFLTGLHPQSHGVLGGPIDPAEADASGQPDPAFLSDRLPSLPALALRAGITTVAVSANPLISRASNFARGFETFVEAGWDHARDDWMPAAEVNAAFARWLRANRGYRFFGYLHYMEPHDPYTPSPDARPPAGPDVRPTIAAGRVEPLSHRLRAGAVPPLPPPELAYLRTLYGLEIRDWDRALAGLLATLDAAGVRGSTVIVVLGDHGEEFQEHGLLKHGVHLYDELLHVPFVIAGPGVPPGHVGDQVQGIDILPTLTALLGLTAPPDLPGKDVLHAASAPYAFSSTRYGILPDGRSAELFSVRGGGWKLISAPALGHAELYDLRADPGEHRDLLGRAPEGERLGQALAAWRAAAPGPPPVEGQDPALGQKLRALGYVD